jgi:hypothetical protein
LEAPSPLALSLEGRGGVIVALARDSVI